ncbi:MAG: 4-alpha-glucanotransferase [Ruminococcaceae bacterium]|nr:4-alpha-glucanotransferase [Oscillospiraceae bacterium]
MNREAGILLPISALPSKYGIGCFSKEAYDFVDFLERSGQSVWQILPLCPTGYMDSPYQSICSFAGNPYFICPERLVGDGLLTDEECENYSADKGNGRIDYGLLYEKRYPLLRKAFERFRSRPRSEEYSQFLTENSFWLFDYALFCAIKAHFGNISLQNWESAAKHREGARLSALRNELSEDIDFHIFTQFQFFIQWHELKAYANKKGIKIMGDIPIYVSADSSDLWVSPHLFLLDSELSPLSVAGCPPDAFSPSGQLWGNPLYDWRSHKKEGYAWWLSRLSHAFSMYDIVRIDHFRGFESYYSVPAGDSDAVGGHWERGVGSEIFRAFESSFGSQDIVAEDLGYVTSGVRQLLRECGFAGMKIIQFGFDGDDWDFTSEYLPHYYGKNSIVYTGTHDNPTLVQWLSSLSESSERKLRCYLCDYITPLTSLRYKVISLAMESVSRLCIIPMQDYLGIGAEGRMNLPASASGNWSWRMSISDTNDDIASNIKLITEVSGRSRKAEN